MKRLLALLALPLLAAGCARNAQASLAGLSAPPVAAAATAAPTPLPGRSVTSGGQFAFTDIPPLDERSAAAPPAPVPTAMAPAAVVVTSGPGRVEIAGNAYGPNALVVPAGTTVTWLQRDTTAHTVTALDREFASPSLTRGETFTLTFKTPGSYVYYCELHSWMLGSVRVEG